jgi:hypothetical protein
VARAEHDILIPWGARLGHVQVRGGPNFEFEGVVSPKTP